MRFFIAILCLFLAVNAFIHEAPGSPCTNQNLPSDATEDNTYDWIFIGAGATDTITASYLAENSSCIPKILVIEAGRDYNKPPECEGEVDCFLKETENDYHLFPSGFPFQVLQSRSSWPFINRPQFHSNSVDYTDGRTENCPFDRPDMIPPGCACVSDVNNQFGSLCALSSACLGFNAGNTTLCGEPICFNPAICAINNTNLYWRSSSKAFGKFLCSNRSLNEREK